ncbi:helix-turn-helix domain-containing protein [Halococcus sp. IIIV-5B]|uniref:winged helix-turn-helix domain-containing protein n=1 Tax=Halococcus sp. IIIV-5B TaxID=2321230 RepID=UPI000E740CFD|nr:helix-turn-helix domain-containing protein [Halococcus sp. IIIV-5B]RJT07531.1 ArsR family transcriptional regulator [Halococcus sp. IIIV-5B]
MTAGSDLDEITDLLDDPYARDILAETSKEPLSAKMLTQRCEASLPTIYRRIDRLQDHDLLAAHQQIDPGGHHYKTYQARLKRVVISLDSGTYTVEINRTEQGAADRFSDLVEGLR